MSLWDLLRSQFTALPYPDEDCTGRTVIVTGASCGLGLEAARHLVRLNAASVILACRSVDRGEAARRDIEASTQRQGVAEVWQLDLGCLGSVRSFAARAAGLERLDVLINNASIVVRDWAMVEGHETMVTVNVVSTLLLSVLLLPTLRRTAARFGVTPRLVTVSSNASFVARLPEGKADRVLDGLRANKNLAERYPVTKLLQLVVTRKLAEAVDASAKGRVVVNALNPGFCRTQLFRLMVGLAHAAMGRDAEMGSRTLLAAAFAGHETHGQWMTDCRLRDAWPQAIEGHDGEKLMAKVWRELVDALERMEPGVMANV